MEDKNMAREELNEQNLEDVVGGAFWFWTEPDGSYHCKVDGVGTFNATTEARRALSLFYIENNKPSAQDMVDYAVANNLFWGD